MSNTKVELIFIPNPGVGHIMSTIEIAKLLVNRDQRLSITVLFIKVPGLGSTTFIQSLEKNTTARISFIELPQDDETPPMIDPKDPMNSFNNFISSHCKYVRNVVSDMMSQPGGSRRVAGFVVDMFCTSMIDVANEFNVPCYVYFTSNAAFLGFEFYIRAMCDDQKQDVIVLSNSDTKVPVPSFAKPLPTKAFWSVVKCREGLDFVMMSARKLRNLKGIMVNTFLELETHAMKSLSDDISVPPVYPVGPILNLEDGPSAGKALDADVIAWLDVQPPSSVVLLCFGSMGCFDEAQVKEIAHALEHSGYRFLWSLRRPSLDEKSIVPGEYADPGMVLLEGFLERTCGIGKVIGWAPQVMLLAHPAVGGFVSHCGWNSLLESLWFGVPTAVWPMYAEQQMNAFEMVVELGLAVEIKLYYKKDMFYPKGDTGIVTSKEIESGIKRLMESNEIRTKVKEMSEKARAAVVEGGSSYASVDRLIQDFIKNIP